MTTLLTASNETQLDADIAEINAAASGSFVIDLTGNIIIDSTGITAFSPQSGVSLTIDGAGYTLDDAGGYSGFIDYGPPSALTFEDLVIQNTSVAPPPPSSGYAGTDTITSTETVDQSSDILLGSANGPGIIDNQGTYEFDPTAAVATGGAPSDDNNYGPAIYDDGVEGDLFINAGTLENTADVVDEIYVDVNSTGTISVYGNIRFDGANNSFSGTYIGGGMIDYGDPLTPGYGTDTLGNIEMTEGACTTSWATVNQSGELILSATSTINSQGTWNFTSDNGMLLDGNKYDVDFNSVFYATSLSKTGGTGTTVIGVPVAVYAPIGVKNSPITVTMGTLQFDGGEFENSQGQLQTQPNQTGPNLFEDALISGNGIFALGGGGADEIDGGTTITTSGWTITDANTDVTLNESLTYLGTFTDQSGANLTLAGGETLTLENLNGTGGSITFDSGSELKFGGQSPSLFAATIDGFTPGNVIDLTSIANVAGSHANMNYTTNVLTITEGSNTYTLDFNPDQNFAGDYFHLTTDGAGTDITENMTPCYCRGTLIRTKRGEVPVEALTIGGKVLTKSGKEQPIKWIGRRSYGGRFIMGRKDVLPICVKAGALDDRVPRRDLWLSPHHALYLDGLLIEAKDLVNGVSIVQADRVEKVEYFHVELETHDVIIAEGALAESFIDDDSRGMFSNAHEYRQLYGDVATGLAQFCAPRREDGYRVEAVRRRIALRAGVSARDEPRPGGLRGFVDRVGANSVEGWAQNIEHPEAPVCLDIYTSGRLIGQVLANRYREDLATARLGSGRHGFVFARPRRLIIGSDKVEVRRSLDGTALPGTRIPTNGGLGYVQDKA